MSMLKRLCRSQEIRKQLNAHRTRLYRVAYAWCHDPDLAEDLVQDTLAKALRKSGQLRDSEALPGWLYQILANEFRDHLRRTRTTTDIDEQVLESPIRVDEEHNRGEIVDKVREAVASLPLGQRQILTLVDLEGLSYQEVADALEIPMGTVMSRLHRARGSLRGLLHELRTTNAPAQPRIRRVK